MQHLRAHAPLALILGLSTAGCFGAFDQNPQGKTQPGGSSSGGNYTPGGGAYSPGGGTTTPGGGTHTPPPVVEPGCFTDADCAGLAVIDDCQVPLCDSATGTCTVGWRPDGAACEDGDICTGGDVCWRGTCAATGDLVLDCDDGDPCTHDYCVPSSGCAWELEPSCAAPTGPCCEPHGGLGCTDLYVEACVCDIDPYCCTASWDDQCASQVESFGCAACIVVMPGPAPTSSCWGSCGGQSPDGCWCDDTCAQYGDCCEDICVECPEACGAGDCFLAADAPGCGNYECEDCVCASDAYCCETAWDETCVGEIDTLGCWACE